MDILLTEKHLRHFLDTKASIEEIAKLVSLSGPTFDRIHQINNEKVCEIEVITNRVDCASAFGIAREANVILKQNQISSKLINNPYTSKKSTVKAEFPIEIEIRSNKLVKRFSAVIINNVQIGDSSPETKKILELSGQQSINNLVDITNETTLLYGLPTHIFDVDKIKNNKIIIREAELNEEITTLDNQTYKLSPGDIVIEDGDQNLIDLCGVMGGINATVDNNTKNILLIAPIYNHKKIRKTSLYHQKRTLAAQIFEKQPDTELSLPVLLQSIKLFQIRANGWQGSNIKDIQVEKPKNKKISIKVEDVSKKIGVNIPENNIIEILNGLGFKIKKLKNKLSLQVPSWRTQDIEILEDVVEEIARIYGYYKLPAVVPQTFTSNVSPNNLIQLETHLRHTLANFGFHEIINNSLISTQLINIFNLHTSPSLRLTNSLSTDNEILRELLSPSLTLNFKHNVGKNFNQINIFEIANIYNFENNCITEKSHISVISSKGILFSKEAIEKSIKSYLHQNITIKYEAQTPEFLEKSNSALIYINNICIGFLGIIKSNILRKLEINEKIGVIEIDLSEVANIGKNGINFKPISDFQDVIEDVTISSNNRIGDIINSIYSQDQHISKVEYRDSFQEKHTFKVTFSSQDSNLTKDEVSKIKDKILKSID